MRDLRMFTAPWARHVAMWSALTLVTSVQSGQLNWNGSTSQTATINAVNVSRAFVVYSGTNNGVVNQLDHQGSLVLTNATTVTALRGTSAANNTQIDWRVIEFAAGVLKSVQQTYVSFLVSASPTATINTVATGRTIMVVGGMSTNGANLNPPVSYYGVSASLALTNSTTVTGLQGASGSDLREYFTVVEFN